MNRRSPWRGPKRECGAPGGGRRQRLVSRTGGLDQNAPSPRPFDIVAASSVTKVCASLRPRAAAAELTISAAAGAGHPFSDQLGSVNASGRIAIGCCSGNR